MPLTTPDYGIAKTIQGGAKYSSTAPGVRAGTGIPYKSAIDPNAQKVNQPLTNQVMGQSQQQPAGYSDLQGLWNSLLPMAGPAIAGADAQIGNSSNMLGQLLAGQQYQGGLIQQQGQTSLAGLGLSQEGLGLQRDILGRQQGLLPQQNALQQQLYGLNSQANQANRSQLEQLYSLGKDDLNRSQADFMSNNRNQVANFRGQTAAQGATVTPGASQGYTTLANQLQSGLADISSQGKRQDIGYQGQLGDINRAQQQQDINKQQYGLNYEEQLAQQKDQAKNLDLVAKQHGLSKDEIMNRTDQALAQLGLSGMLTSGQIFSSIISAQNGKFDALTPILGAIYQYIGLRPMSGGK